MYESIGVILNAYKRTDLLETQIQSLIDQTIPPSKIYIWNNSEKPLIIKNNYKIAIEVFGSSKNLGVWARFAVALNLDETYISVMDDDTIPGVKWFENCLKHINDGNRILGTRGLRFLSDKNYAPFESFGWDNPNDELIEVDILGHSWFFHRKVLGAFWGSLEDQHNNKLCGEDMHLSYTGQTLGCFSYVPPHNIDDTDSWGSKPELAIKYGTNSAAISSSSSAIVNFTKAYRHYISKGLKIYYSSNKSPAKILIKTNLRETGFFKFISRFPLLYKLLKKTQSFLNKLGVHF